MITANNDNTASPSDEDLFNEPPPAGDCPICFLRLPALYTGRRYKTCCGKVICSGCIHAPVYDNNGNKVKKKCPFCRTQAPTSGEEYIQMTMKRMEAGDAIAINCLGGYYSEGKFDLPQDMDKALEIWHRAAELGHSESYYNIGNSYFHGRGVARDEEKAKYYWELAAIRGDVDARHNLGILEGRAENYDRALKHYMIAVGTGYNKSLNQIKEMYMHGFATKDDYANALLAYQAYLVEIKSDQRDNAAAFGDMYKYYE